MAGASLQTLARLVDTSLLHVDRDGRFDRHPLISQYTQEKLEGTGEAEAVRNRHARFFNDLAAQAFPQLLAVGRVSWLDRLSAEHLNLTQTLDHLRQNGQAQAVLGMCADLMIYWMQRGHEIPGRQRRREAILNAGAARGTLEYARAQCMLANGLVLHSQPPTPEEMQWLREGIEGCRRWGEQRTLVIGLRGLAIQLALQRTTPDTQARDLVHEARHISEAMGDVTGVITSETNLGVLALWAGDHLDAQRRFERALSMAQGLGDPSVSHTTLLYLAEWAMQRRDYMQATQLYRTCLSVSQQLGQVPVANTSYQLGIAYLGLGEFEAATSMLQKALRLYRQQGNSWLASSVLMNLAYVAAEMNKLDESEQLLQVAEQEAGSGWQSSAWMLSIQGKIYSKREQLDAAREMFLAVMGQPYNDDTAMPILSALLQYLTLPHPTVDVTGLACLLGILPTLQSEIGISPSPGSRTQYKNRQQEIATRARRELGDTTFEQIISAAQQLTFTEAVEVVRQHASTHLKTRPPVS